MLAALRFAVGAGSDMATPAASMDFGRFLDALDERDMLPTVRVHRWMDRSATEVKLHGDFARFDRTVRGASRASEAARVYWFPDPAMIISQRQELTSSSFSLFCTYVRGAVEPDVWVWEPVGTTRSPTQLPSSVVQEAPTTPAPVAAPSRGTGRSSQVQKKFRAGVIERDGVVCTLCGRVQADKDLDAAHVVRHSSSLAVMREAGLASLDDTNNGVMLCSNPCHFWFDQLHWWIDGHGLVTATDALLSDAELGSHFGRLIGRSMQLPRTEFMPIWPSPRTWAVQERLCNEATAQRREAAVAAEFPCIKCGQRFVRASNLKTHVAGCAATSRRLLFTPAERAAMPAGALDVVADVVEEALGDDASDDSG